MADNPLTDRLAKVAQPKRSQQEWIERGNRILWGQEPNRNGEYLAPRLDLHWVCRNGSYSIEEL